MFDTSWPWKDRAAQRRYEAEFYYDTYCSFRPDYIPPPPVDCSVKFTIPRVEIKPRAHRGIKP